MPSLSSSMFRATGETGRADGAERAVGELRAVGPAEDVTAGSSDGCCCRASADWPVARGAADGSAWSGGGACAGGLWGTSLGEPEVEQLSLEEREVRERRAEGEKARPGVSRVASLFRASSFHEPVRCCMKRSLGASFMEVDPSERADDCCPLA